MNRTHQELPHVVHRHSPCLLTEVPAGAAAAVLAPSMAHAASNGRGLTITSNVRVGKRIWDFRFATTAMTLFQPSIRVLLRRL